MNYSIKEIEKDTKYMGIKYKGEIESFHNIDLPSFWNEFTEKLYNSGAENLTHKKEALGYIEINQGRYTYFAACETEEFEDIYGFHKIEIPKGKYLFIKMRFKDKNIELDRILKKELKEIAKDMELKDDFAFEFYTEEFDYRDENTELFFVVGIK